MFDSRLLAALIHELGGKATPVVQIGCSEDRFNITGVQFEHSHYKDVPDTLVIIGGDNNLAMEPKVPSIKREYFLAALVYEAANQYTKDELLEAANDGYGRACSMYETFWDEYPEAVLTEEELQEVFIAAVRTFTGDNKE